MVQDQALQGLLRGGTAPGGRFKQALGAASCPGGPSVRGLCTGGGNILLVAAEKGDDEKGRRR